MFITRYTSFFFLCIFLIPFIFVLASKRNNYTDSEMDTLVVFSFCRLDHPWSTVMCMQCVPGISVARCANSASSCYAIAICSEPKFMKNLKSYRCVCKKNKNNNYKYHTYNFVEIVDNFYPARRAATRPFFRRFSDKARGKGGIFKIPLVTIYLRGISFPR